MDAALRRSIVVLLAGIALAPCVGSARPRQPCSGRFYVVEEPGGTTLPPVGWPIDVGSRSVRMYGSCAASVARVRATAHRTVVRARWSACGNLRRVRLSARIDAPGCDILRGTVRASGVKAGALLAHRSLCGDGHVDAPDEACESAADCAAGELCTSSCTCEPVGSATTTTIPDGGTTTTTIVGPAGCHVESVPYEGHSHVAVGTTISWAHDPPASGQHYPYWATYAAHADVVPRGYWVHNLEHGAIVLLHRPDAPAAVVAAVQAAYAAIPNDPECGHKRALVTPDPLLGPSFAAVAWNYVMECVGPVDVQSVLDFTAQHRNHGGEDVCAQGAFD